MEHLHIRELTIHTFAGDFPSVATYPGVNSDLLTEGDDNPFYVTLAIAQVGRISENGLLYDEALVSNIARQLQGSGGIRGHIPEGEETTAFPIDAVDWVGHVIANGILWAKAYVPPGETREYIRRLKARSGSLGTSIYGYGQREIFDESKNVWKIHDFELHSVDLAPAKMASLQMGGHFRITAETINTTEIEESEAVMDQDSIRIEDVPQDVRELIIQQSGLPDNAERVSELAQQVANLQSRVAELDSIREAGVARISELEQQVGERDERIRELRATQFTQELNRRITELTDWQVRNEDGKHKLAAIRKTLLRDVAAELADQRDESAIEPAIQRVWEDNKILLETVRDSLMGPAAIIGGIDNRQAAAGTWESYRDNPAALQELKRKWNMD